MELARQNPENDSIAFTISSRRIHVYSTHLPGNDPERVDIAGLCMFCANKPEALRINQFRGSTVEEPIDVNPWHGGWNRGRSEASNTNMSISVDEDVGLDERERMIKIWEEEGPHNLKVPMNGVGAVHVLQDACYFKQLMSRC